MSEETKTEQPTSDINEGNKPEAIKADEGSRNTDIEKLEEDNKRLKAALDEREQLLARSQLGGRSFAGQPQKTAEEIAEEKEDQEVKKALNRFK